MGGGGDGLVVRPTSCVGYNFIALCASSRQPTKAKKRCLKAVELEE